METQIQDDPTECESIRYDASDRVRAYLEMALESHCRWQYHEYDDGQDEHVVTIMQLSLRDVECLCPYLDVVDVIPDSGDESVFVLKERDTPRTV